MKEEVAQHCVRLLDARDTLRGHYDRDYQLRAMGYFILVAKFHNRVQVKVNEEKKTKFCGRDRRLQTDFYLA